MSEFELRRALRRLPTARAPERDLWQGIAARIGAQADGSADLPVLANGGNIAGARLGTGTDHARTSDLGTGTDHARTSDFGTGTDHARTSDLGTGTDHARVSNLDTGTDRASAHHLRTGTGGGRAPQGACGPHRAAMPPSAARHGKRWALPLALAAALVLSAGLSLHVFAPGFFGAGNEQPDLLATRPSTTQPAPTQRTATRPSIAAPDLHAAHAQPPLAAAPRSALPLHADAMALEYALALQQLGGVAAPPLLEQALDELDHSAEQIRDALRQDPESGYLLTRLKRTYAQRLRLTQLAATG